MAETLLLPLVEVVIGKAANALVQSITRLWGVDDDRRRLERRLMYLQSLLADAEVKSETDPAVKAWMKALKTVAYKADDVLDDFQYEALRREAQSSRSMASKVLSYFSSKNRIVLRHKASRDLKGVLDKIEELVTEMKSFGLLEHTEAPQAIYRQTHSALDETEEVYGRDDDKALVVNLLLDQRGQKHVQVLPITGMGGLGKTTLAKMVYNDDRIQKHFELKMWHCVSENFEATAVVKSVVELATNKRCDLHDAIELLRVQLQDAIGRKRFLLVLDDVWNENQHRWESDLKPLLCSSIGSVSEEKEVLHLPMLERLRIEKCESMLEIPMLPASLEGMWIDDCKSLMALPSNLGNLTKLRRLSLSDCSGLKALPDGVVGFSSLEQLRIYKCPEIKEFPHGLLQQLPSLTCLSIRVSPDLQRRCREGGEYFDLVCSIPCFGAVVTLE
nr:unnamed protein product [Digitaria exilis]